jgi:uncharacterized RDD family membrane protein YckC
MGCPKCQCTEISAAGICLWCGYQVNAAPEESEPVSQENQTGPIHTIEYESETPEEVEPEVMPPWRQELSQRLLSIKHKRQTAVQKQNRSEIPLTAKADSGDRPHPNNQNLRPPSSQGNGRDAVSPDLPQESLKPSEPDPSVPEPVLESSESPVIQDSINFKQSEESFAANESSGFLSQSIAAFKVEENRKILLYRTLSGFMDLLLIFLSTSALIFAANYFAGKGIWGMPTLINDLILFLFIYVLYSLFFIGLSNQTIGMMITNLHVTSAKDEEPLPLRRVLALCFSHLFSLLFAGIGLIWALFDPEHLCLHDRLTNTRVVPLAR